MDFGKNALGSFVRDMGKAVFARPERTEQVGPVKRPQKNMWGDTKSYVDKQSALRMYANKNRKYIFDSEGKKIKLTPDEREEVIETKLFENTNKLTRERALKAIRLGHKEARAERAKGVLPSEAKKTRDEEKLLDMMKPGPRVVRPGIGRGVWNTIRMAAGKEPILTDTSSLDASTINKNIGEIKQ